MRMRPRERLSGGNLRKRDCWRSHVKFERSTGTVAAFFPLLPPLSFLSSRTNVRLLKARIAFRDRWSRLSIERRARCTRRRFLSKMESPAERPSNHLQVPGTRSECVRDVRERKPRSQRGSRGVAGVTGWRAASRDTTTRKTVRFWRYNATMLIIAAALPMPWRALAIDSKWPPPRNRTHASVTRNSPYGTTALLVVAFLFLRVSSVNDLPGASVSPVNFRLIVDILVTRSPFTSL